MAALLALVTVVCWGTWIPVAQAPPGIHQSSRTLYVAVGNLAFATCAFVSGGHDLVLTWRGFWLPLAGGGVWTAGGYCAFRATELVGLARAAGTWTPLNIVTAFVWGAALFGELSGLSAAHWAALAAGTALVVAGVLLIVRSQDVAAAAVRDRFRSGLLYALGAGVLWGSYFVPAQWAKVPAAAGNFPLAAGILAGAAALMAARRAPVLLSAREATFELSSGVLFGIGNLTLLGLVHRVGTGTGFTIAQLSLLFNAMIGIWVFKVPRPGSRAARVVMVGVAVAGAGGCLIGALR